MRGTDKVFGQINHLQAAKARSELERFYTPEQSLSQKSAKWPERPAYGEAHMLKTRAAKDE